MLPAFDNRRFRGFNWPFFTSAAIAILLSLPGLENATTEAEASTTVSVELRTSNSATDYRSRRGDCTITWTAFNNEPGVVKSRADCTAPLAAQVPLMKEACAVFLANDRNAEAFRTLFWGRLAPNGAADSDMSFRLAAAAFASPDWDKTRGKPRQGDVNRFVRDLANQVCIYPELTELFGFFHRTVTLGTVEKVLVAPAGQLPFFPRLATLGVASTDRLPFDCMAWFAIGKPNL